ncbi:MAG: iron-containing alcohol dehydrogenase [Thermotogaceae bacterium]|nr:iron-containing alcohol dehydrogenase [Thermotogaceae bacterium]
MENSTLSNFEICNPVKVVYGVGKLNEAEKYLSARKVLVICDPVVQKLGYVDVIQRIFLDCDIFGGIEPNPSCKLVNSIVDNYSNAQIDGIIGIGGGSSLDTSKAVSALLSNGGKIEDYLLGAKKFNSRLPLVLIPTTAGTGSEVTNVGVFTHESIKRPMTSDKFWADVAIIDPQLTYSMPPRVAASTGLDALTHAIESYWAKSSQPYTEGLALKATKMVFENLTNSINGDKDARNNMSLAATIAGIAFSQTRTTAAHAISFPLTSFYGIEHGLAVVLTLPKLVLWTYPYVTKKMDELLMYLDMKDIEELSARIEKLISESGFSTRLRDYNVKLEELEDIAKVSMEANIVKLTPGDMKYEDVLQLLNTIY